MHEGSEELFQLLGQHLTWVCISLTRLCKIKLHAHNDIRMLTHICCTQTIATKCSPMPKVNTAKKKFSKIVSHAMPFLCIDERPENICNSCVRYYHYGCFSILSHAPLYLHPHTFWRSSSLRRSKEANLAFTVAGGRDINGESKVYNDGKMSVEWSGSSPFLQFGARRARWRRDCLLWHGHHCR